MLFLGQCGCERHDFLLLFSESSFQKRVSGLAQVHLSVFGNYRHSSDEFQCNLSLCHNEVDLSKIFGRSKQVCDIRAEEVGEFQQDAQYFPLLGESQLLYLVVKLDYFGRLDECSLSCSGLVIDESGNLLLVGCADRDEHLSVTYGNSCVAVDNAFFLCSFQDSRHSSGNGAFLLFQCPSDLVEGVRCGVLDVTVTVEDKVYPSLYFREAQDARTHPFQIRIHSVLHSVEECGNLSERVKHRPEFAQRQKVNGS